MVHPYQQPMYPWPAPLDRFTVDDLADLPRTGHTYEIIDGGLRVTTPADIRHHAIADEIMIALRAAAPMGWRAVREVGIQAGDSSVVPDLAVLGPQAPLDTAWADPADVALVVEVESQGSRRHDQYTKLALYAELGIESYWRIERTEPGPVAHLYEVAAGGHYQHHRAVNPGQSHLVELPYPVQVSPTTWIA